jgi:hypothetical protein
MIPKIKAGDMVMVSRLSSIFTPPQSLGKFGEVLEVYKTPFSDGEFASISTKNYTLFVGVALCDLEFFEGSQIDAD